MYDLVEYGNMIADRVRSDAYARALKRVITPNSVVLDIGAATGIHSLLACKFGAKHVYAVESNPAIHLARELAEANGFADRITFFHDLSTSVTLPQKADVIVSDLRGVLPLFTHHIGSIADARERHLASGGVLIPQRDKLCITLIEAPRLYHDLIEPWDKPYGLNMDAARTIALNRWNDGGSESFRANNMLTDAELWAELDYTTITEPNVGGSTLQQTVKRAGTAHGLLIWFDSELLDGIGYSNGPHSTHITDVYGRAFFPLLEPIALSAGDAVSITVSAELINDNYVWRWQTKVTSSGVVKAEFAQSSAFEGALDIGRIAQSAATTKPDLSADGNVDHFILGLMDGQTSLAEIAHQTFAHFPLRFTDPGKALSYVYEIAQQYR